jgi:hypothetical protein
LLEIEPPRLRPTRERQRPGLARLLLSKHCGSENQRRSAMRWSNRKTRYRLGATRAAAWPFLLTAGLLSGPFVAAEPFQISVVIDSSNWTLPVAASKAVIHLSLRGQCGSGIEFGSPAAHPEVELTVPGTATLDLPARSRWDIDLEADEVWAQRRSEVSADSGSIEICATPAVRLDARLLAAAGLPLPPMVAVRYFRESPAGLTGSGQTLCPVAAGLMRCVLPAGGLDLYFDPVEPFALLPPRFAGLATNATLHLGELPLERALTLDGQVIVERGNLPAAIAVELRQMPVNIGGNEAGLERMWARMRRTTHTASDGTFTFTGVAPGPFFLRANAAGLAGETPSMDIGGSEPPPRVLLVLKPEVELRVQITPPRDREGQPWKLELVRGFFSDRLSGETDATGKWSPAALMQGRYSLVVAKAKGMWARRELMVEPGMAAVVVEFHPLAVAGRVTRGGAPRRAAVLFRGADGSLVSWLEAGEDGGFHGEVPEAGRWTVEVVDWSPGAPREVMQLDLARPSAGEPQWLELQLPAGH